MSLSLNSPFWKNTSVFCGVGLLLAAIALKAAAQNPADFSLPLLEEAVQAFVAGDSAVALAKVEASLAGENQNKTERFLRLRLLVDLGSRFFLLGEYEEAWQLLARAYDLESEDQMLRDMIILCARRALQLQLKLKTQALGQAAAQASKLNPSEHLLNSLFIQGYATKPLSQETSQEENREMLRLAGEFQSKIMAGIFPDFELTPGLRQGLLGKTGLALGLDQLFKGFMGKAAITQRVFAYGLGLGAGLSLLLFGALGVSLGRWLLRREEAIMSYQREMMKSIRNLVGEPLDAPQGSFSPGAQYYRQAVQGWIPESGFVTGKSPMQAHDLIRSLELRSEQGNYKERALAMMQLLQIAEQKALPALENAMADHDPFFRECVVGSMGAYYHVRTVAWLLDALNDPEPKVIKAAQRSLRRLLRLPPALIPQNTREHIEKELQSGLPASEPGKKRRNRKT